MRGVRKTGTKKASDSPCKLAALPGGLFEGSQPSLGGVPARRRRLHWKDVMWQGAGPQAGVSVWVVKRRGGQKGRKEVENEYEKLWRHQNR